MAGARVVNRLPQFVETVERNAAAAMVKALVIGASEASVMTPIDTSTLLNSQYLQVTKEGARILGTVGYTASYALPVHSPDHPQKFRRPTAMKEFLRLGFENAEPNIRAVITGAIKT